jgi:hypothetical protein
MSGAFSFCTQFSKSMKWFRKLVEVQQDAVTLAHAKAQPQRRRISPRSPFALPVEIVLIGIEV